MAKQTVVTVDEQLINKAAIILNDLWDEVTAHPDAFDSCPIKTCIDFVLVETQTKTWPYILMTQLLGKAADERVNILAMHKSSSLDGAWDARSLCEHVISRDGCFEPTVLLGILGGVKQPYNNSPGQKLELSKSNQTAAAHVPIRDAVIDGLSQIEDSEAARFALGYFLSVCNRRMKELIVPEPLEEGTFAKPVELVSLRSYLCNLARKGRDGEGLALAAGVLLSLVFHEEDGYTVNLYQTNTSRRAAGYQADLEVYFISDKRLAMELKDKTFSASEALSAAEQAWSAGFSRFQFVYGYGSGHVGYEVFSAADMDIQRTRGVFASCVGFEQLVDSLLPLVVECDLEDVRALTIQLIEDAHIKARTQTLARELLRRLLADAGQQAL